jgi:hypothetical protein
LALAESSFSIAPCASARFHISFWFKRCKISSLRDLYSSACQRPKTQRSRKNDLRILALSLIRTARCDIRIWHYIGAFRLLSTGFCDHRSDTVA